MTKQTAIKNVIWAICIGLALLALLIGLFISAVEHYYGDKTRPVMNIGAPVSASSKKADKDVALTGLAADGTLHELKNSGDAGQGYLDGLTFLCDSVTLPLKNSGLVAGDVWSGENGQLPMTSAFAWKILLPSDGSVIAPSSAVMAVKPKTLVLAIGSDDAAGINRDDFVENYKMLLASLREGNPDTVIICGSVCSVTTAYAGSAGPSAERAAELNEWIKAVCTDTGAYYADWFSTLTDGGYLRPEYAEADGRTLSSAGLTALLGWLRSHAAS